MVVVRLDGKFSGALSENLHRFICQKTRVAESVGNQHNLGQHSDGGDFHRHGSQQRLKC